MSHARRFNVSPERIKKIEQNLLTIFVDVYFNHPNILKAKSESDLISDKIRDFILSFSESQQQVSEVDLLITAKEKGQELVENHELVFFDEKVDKNLTMRAFLIPGMKIDFNDENASERVTEDDLQTVDHELCASFKTSNMNEFVKLGNLLDIRAKLAKELSGKAEDKKVIVDSIRENSIFQEALESVLDTATKILRSGM